jgi:hypothetical protein
MAADTFFILKEGSGNFVPPKGKPDVNKVPNSK